MNILETITSGKNALANIEKIEAQLFNVVKVPLITNVSGFDAPTAFGMYKTQGGKPLGVVGNDFTPQQPKELFPLFTDGLLNCANQDFDTDKLTYTELKDGKKIIFSVPIGKMGFKNLRGEFDETIITLNLQTGFDGLTKTSLFLSSYRMVCANGMKASVTEFQASFKNTKGNQGKAVSLVGDIVKQVNNVETLNEMYLALNKVQINQTIVDAYVKKVMGLDVNEFSNYGAVKQRNYSAVMESINLELSRTGNTPFGLFNGITHYTNHVSSSQDLDYLFSGAGTKINDNALKFALELI